MDIISILFGLFGLALGALGVYAVFVSKLQKQTAELSAKLSAEKEKTSFISNSKEEFSALAAQVLKDDKQALTQKNTETINPLKDDINNFRKRLETITKEQSDDRSALKQQIENLSQANQDTLKGAEKLANALTYDNKQQGDWGELVLESILEDSGLEKDQQYHVQQSLKNAEGNFLRPDVIVHLPDNKDIIIDSKVSLKYYQEYVAGDTSAIIQHIKSIDNHIKNISLKSYENLPSVHTLDYIFVFFPIEASLLVALEQKPDLFNDALKKNVALVSPSTLMMSLKTINHIWNTERQNQNTEEIVRQAGNMYDKFVLFIDSMKGISDSLNAAQNKYDDAYKQLSSGKDNLIRKTELLKKLGITTKKELKE